MTSASKEPNRKVISSAECGQIHPRERATRNGSAYVEACARKVGRKVTAFGSGDSEMTIGRKKKELVNDTVMDREKKEYDSSEEWIMQEQRCRKKIEATMATANLPSTVRQSPVEKESTNNTKQAESYLGKDNG